MSWRDMYRGGEGAEGRLIAVLLALALVALTPGSTARASTIPQRDLRLDASQSAGWRGTIEYSAQLTESVPPTPQNFLKVNGRTSLVSSTKNSYSRHDVIILADGAPSFTSHAERVREVSLQDRGVWDCGARRPSVAWSSDTTTTTTETGDATGPLVATVSLFDDVYTLNAVVPLLRGKRVQTEQITRAGQCKDSDNGTTRTSTTSDMSFDALTVSHQDTVNPDQPDTLDGEATLPGPGSAILKWHLTRSATGCDAEKIELDNRARVLRSMVDAVRTRLGNAQGLASTDTRAPQLLSTGESISQALEGGYAASAQAAAMGEDPDLAVAAFVSNWLTIEAPNLAASVVGLVVGIDGLPDLVPQQVGQELLAAQQVGQSLATAMSEMIGARERLALCQAANPSSP